MAMLSEVLEDDSSVFSFGGGRNKFGPNIVARLPRDILLSASCLLTLEKEREKDRL
jgi:hypothetical protein